MAVRGSDGEQMPMGPASFGEPMMELLLGEVGIPAIAPTLIVMQNLPSIASLASSLATFVLQNDLTDDLMQWMYRAMCEHHRHELPDDIVKVLSAYKNVIDNYLESVGYAAENPCEHEGEDNG